MKESHIWYSLNVKDIQGIAFKKLGRKLTDAEVKDVIHFAEQCIAYADAIRYAIQIIGIH